MDPERSTLPADTFVLATGSGRSSRGLAQAWRRRREVLASPRIGSWAAGLALLLTLRALWGGWHFDDHLQRVKLLGLDLPGASVADANIFDFSSGEAVRGLMDLGMLPWWTLETLRWSFWRPLSSATHQLDHLLWPSSAPAMHAHSLLWLALLVLVVSGLYRASSVPPGSRGSRPCSTPSTMRAASRPRGSPIATR